MPDAPVTPSSDPTVVPEPRRKRHWLRWIGALVLLLIFFIALLPTLLSLSPARSFIVGRLQSIVPNGKLTVDDWSLGWFSPIRIDGVKLYDTHGDLVAEANTIKTDLTIVKAIRQRFDLGETLIDADATHVIVYPDGSSNLQRLFASNAKHETEAPKKEPNTQNAKPSQLPDVHGNITLKLKGNVQLVDAADKPIVTVQLHDGSGGTIKIDDINTGITPDLKLIYDTGDPNATSDIAVSGSVDAIKNNALNLQDMAAKIQLVLTTVDLKAAQPFLAMAGQSATQVQGMAGGTIAGDLQPGQTGSIAGELSGADFQLATPKLEDVYKANIVRIPVQVSRVAVNGVSQLKIDTSIVLPEATVHATGDLPEVALSELQNKKMPTEPGTATITLNADPKKLSMALPKTMHLLPGMTIDGGTLTSVVSAQIDPQKQAIMSHVKADLSVTGQQNGQAKSIPPISLTADAAITRLDDLTAGLHDMAASLSSGFANLKIAGPTLTSLQGNGDADLDKLSSQISQFADIGKTKLAGQAKFSLASQPAASGAGAIHADLNADVQQLDVTLSQKAPITMPIAHVALAADVQPDAANGIKSIQSATLTMLAGDSADKPLIDVQANAAGYDIAAKTFQSLNIDKCTVSSLHDAQVRLIDPFLNTLKDQHIDLADGALYFVAKVGPSDINTRVFDLPKCDASLPNVRVERDGKELLKDTIRFSAAGKSTVNNGVTVVDLSKVALQSTLAKVTGTDIEAQLPDGKTPAIALVKKGQVVVGVSDLAKAQAVLTAFSPGTQLPAQFGGGAALDATVADGTATVQFNGSRLTALNAKGDTFAFDKKKQVSLKAVMALPQTMPITSVNISQLDGDLDLAQIKTTGPLTVTNLDTKAQANGQLTITSSLDRLGLLLQVLQSAAQPWPYRGTLNVQETVATKDNVIALTGGGTIDQFQMTGTDGKVQFTEPKVTLVNDATVDQDKQIATLKNANVEMTSSKAATLNLTGVVSQWASQRTLNNVVLKVNADGAKAWPLVYAMLSPAQQTRLKDATVKGPVTANFNLGGAYPVAPTWNASFKSVTGTGSLSADSVSALGLDIQKFALPLTIANGNVATAKGLTPFTVNGGHADFSNVIVNAGDPNLLLSIAPNQKLLQQVQFNSIMATQLGSLASVVFKDSKDASGVLDLTAVQCQNLPLTDPTGKQANATFFYSIHGMKVDGPVPSTLAQLLELGDQGFVGDINNASLALNNGIAYQDMTIAVQKPADQSGAKTSDATTTAPATQNITFKGGIDLAQNKFDNYAMTIPNGLLLRDWRKSFPNGATVNLNGNVDDVAGILTQGVGKLAVQGYGGGSIDKLLGNLGGKKKKKNQNQ